ncbi:hypothetical protein B7Z28_01555, partial [Candidatus Saccharibacteria bacterium 32-45-3]
AFIASEISAAYGLTNDDIKQIEETELVQSKTLDVDLDDGVFAFFNNDVELLTDVKVRKALLASVNRQELLALVSRNGSLLEGPLLSGQIEGVSLVRQAKFDLAQASSLLDEAGWVFENGNTVRTKEGRKLALRIVSPRAGANEHIVDELENYWKAIGAEITKKIIDPEKIATDYLLPRDYDVLVYQLSIGADPDVYAYWHSSQAAKGFNFSNYRSVVADDILSSARSRIEPALRSSKYKSFVDQWQKDTPAIALFQPSANYTTLSTSTSIHTTSSLADSVSRYRAINRWTVNEAMLFTTR